MKINNSGKMAKRITLTPLLMFWLTGCVSSDMMTVGETYPPRPDNYLIEVFCTEDAPIQIQQQIAQLKPVSDIPKNANVIGRVDSRGAPLATWGSVVGDAMGKARSIGGDAIVVTQWGQPVSYVGSYGEVQHSKAISFRVIRYLRPH
jgi:hypothetical protein